ncbi:MAG: hypothetical protein JXB49_21180 [Bacteroidales bacterium]|nr:hypothetical protein [Bacteroidales bacterium]
MREEKYINDKFTIDELIRRSWNLRKADTFTKFIDFIAKFDHYSRFNTMLVYIQNEEVTFFGGTSYWRKNFNRTIKKDAKPYIILAPKSPVMLVYDVMDTEGEDNPIDFLNRMLGEKLFEVKGHLNPQIYHGAIYMAKTWGIPVIQKPLSYFKAGFVTTALAGRLEICLKEGATVEENFTVLLHELAHILCGHTGHMELRKTNPDKRLVLPERGKLTRSNEELEAETVSYLISTKLGLIPKSAEYLSGYITGIDDLLQFSYETVIKVADKIDNMFLQPTNKILKPTPNSLF